MKYGYVRVSTREQNEDRQVESLKLDGIAEENIYVDKAGGNSMERPFWNHLMQKVEIGDTIVIKELDRLGRNLEQIKDTYGRLGRKGVFIKILENEMLSTEGRSEIELKLIQPMMIQLLGYIAEKERAKIKARQEEGINLMLEDEKGRKVSKKTGRYMGRPNKQENLTKEQQRYIKAWLSKSIKLSDCIKATGLSRATLYRIKRNTKEG